MLYNKTSEYQEQKENLFTLFKKFSIYIYITTSIVKNILLNGKKKIPSYWI